MTEDQAMFMFSVFVVCWIGSGFLLLHLLSREMREWVVGPADYEILGVCTMCFPPVGVWELWKARKMNREKTFPNAIVSVWFREEGK